MTTTTSQPGKQFGRWAESLKRVFKVVAASSASLTALCFAPLQVLHQLKQLATVWQDVLPVSIYCKAMGNLLNTAITEVTAKIMMLEVCRCCDFRDVPC